MTLTISWRDIGADCDFVAKGATMEELETNVLERCRDAHGLTGEQVNESQMLLKIRGAMRIEKTP
ncbi:MAG: DUF1059 domain-containing protein [Thermoplasmata archaeon]